MLPSYTPAGYELAGPLGHGGYGTVHLVRRSASGLLFAMKTIDLSILEVKDVQAIKGEADLLKRLRHKNIVYFVEAVLQSTSSTETLYLIMEYCKGGDLERYLAVESKRGRKIRDSFVLVWLRQLSKGIKGTCFCLLFYTSVEGVDFGRVRKLLDGAVLTGVQQFRSTILEVLYIGRSLLSKTLKHGGQPVLLAQCRQRM